MFKKILFATAMTVMPFSAAMAQGADDVPTLIVTNKPIVQVMDQQELAKSPQEMASINTNARIEMSGNLYSKPTRLDDISVTDVMGADYYSPVNTMTSQKINEIQNEMYDLQAKVADSASQLQTLEIVGQDLAANYYAAVATINTQLQSGTTPGNPRLKNRLVTAEDALDTLSGNVADLNKIAVAIADLASVSNFLQQQARSAYGLSGSVEEDHVQLAQLEDELANTAVAIERLLNSVNDNITRAAAYMTSERANLRTLALAITNGDLYGKSLASRPFSMAPASLSNNAGMNAQMASQVLNQPRPLIKIRFDRPDVNYTQALYMSVSEAMQQYPSSQFELVAVSPGMGNPAKLAIESTKARRNAEMVLRDMVQMGVDSNLVNLANLTEDELQYNEVHLYIR